MAADTLQDLTNLDDSRLYAALSYLMVLAVVPWLVRRNDPFVNWHIRQGLLVFLLMLFALITARWWNIVGSLLFLVLLLGDVVALVMALHGRRWKIPVIGALATRIRV